MLITCVTLNSPIEKKQHSRRYFQNTNFFSDKRVKINFGNLMLKQNQKKKLKAFSVFFIASARLSFLDTYTIRMDIVKRIGVLSLHAVNVFTPTCLNCERGTGFFGLSTLFYIK